MRHSKSGCARPDLLLGSDDHPPGVLKSVDDPDAYTVYEATGARYAAANETSPYNALYERPAMIELLGDVSGKRVLDVGCGAGPLSQWLVDHGAEVCGFDLSPTMVGLAQARGLSHAEFHTADLAEPLLFLPDDSFDVAAVSLVLHYLRDWVAPLRELRRVLVPGGSLMLSTHHPADDVKRSVTGNYFDLELLRTPSQLGVQVEVRFWRRPLTAMFAAFAEAGFTVEALIEPMPLEECRTRFPEAWTALTTRPAFVFFQLTASSTETNVP